MASSCVRPSALLLVAVCVGAMLGSPLAAQSQRTTVGAVYLTGERLKADKLVDLSTVPWRFKEGDDPVWAEPVLDDSAWALSDTDFQPDSLYPDLWQGLGWFRLHIQVDSALHHTMLALSMYHLGASEIYLDGKYIGGFGVIGATAETDRPYTPKGLPLTVALDDRDTHVLAVRYTNRSASAKAVALFRDAAYLPVGFAVVLGENPTLIHSFVNGVRSFWTEGVLMGILAIMSLLHLVLFLFDRRERVNLYYSLATAGLAVCVTCASVIQRRELILDGFTDLVRLNDIVGFGADVFFLFLLLTFYSLFARQWMRFFWGFGLLWIALVLFYTIAGGGSPFIFQLLSLLVMLEALRITAYAIYKRKEGAWILGTGVLTTLLVLVVTTITGSFDPTQSMSRLTLWETPQLVYPEFYDVLLFVLPIPVSMSILLARRFVARSRRLEHELVRVEELSEQTLAQEREKQALIASQNERLEAEVTERTSELRQSLATLKATQAQLVQQDKMASLGQLTAGIAHEIKNPLNFVNNFAEVNEELAQELREAYEANPDVRLADLLDIVADLEQNAQVINQHGKRADGIVHAMMQHASGGTGQRQPTAINALVSEYIDLAYHGKRAQVPGLKVEIERDLDEHAGTAELVPQEIGRVLLNLLSNAFDAVHEHAETVNDAEGRVATRPYTPAVTVSTRRRAIGDRGEACLAPTVEIRISDNGPGIPPNIREKIFEPFFTTKPTGSGTGLGLSLSYDIVTQGHGGMLAVESEEGLGTTFIVTLPAPSSS